MDEVLGELLDRVLHCWRMCMGDELWVWRCNQSVDHGIWLLGGKSSVCSIEEHNRGGVKYSSRVSLSGIAKGVTTGRDGRLVQSIGGLVVASYSLLVSMALSAAFAHVVCVFSAVGGRQRQRGPAGSLAGGVRQALWAALGRGSVWTLRSQAESLGRAGYTGRQTDIKDSGINAGEGSYLTRTPLILALEVDVDGVVELVVELFVLLLLQRVACNHVKGLVNVDRLLRTRLEQRQVAQVLRKRLRLLRAHSLLRLVNVHLVADDDKGEALRVLHVGLDEELVLPQRHILKRLRVRHVIDEDTTVRTSVKGHAQRLESLLASGVPKLHRHRLVIQHELLGEEVCSNGRLVLLRELAVHKLLHEGRLAHSGVSEDDHFQQGLLSGRHCCCCCCVLYVL